MRAGGDFPGGREEPVAPAFDVSGLGAVAVRECSELDPRDDIVGEWGDVRQGLVRGEVEKQQLAQTGVKPDSLRPSPLSIQIDRRTVCVEK